MASLNERVLWIVLGLMALAVPLRVLVENRRFSGPPVAEEVARRQALIAARRRAVGEAD